MADEKTPTASDADLAALARKRDRIQPSAEDLADMRAALGLDELEERVDVLERFSRGEGNVPQPRRAKPADPTTDKR